MNKINTTEIILPSLYMWATR